MELSFWGACGIVGVGKSDKVITGGASKALPERCKQKIRRLKNSGFQTVEKPLSMIKMGCRVLLALLVLHRATALCGCHYASLHSGFVWLTASVLAWTGR